jgi:hypothetical protein
MSNRTSSGAPLITRRSAKNYIHAEAQKRFTEVLPQIQSQGLNALRVDAHLVTYYSKVHGGYTCSCKVKDNSVEGAFSEDDTSNEFISHSPSNEIKIDFNRPLFGEIGEVLTAEELASDDVSDFLHSESFDSAGTTGLQEHLFAGSNDCGICHKTGYIPGYAPQRHNRMVLTHYHMVDLESMHLNKNAQPHAFESLNSESSITFKFVVPKYWKKVSFSTRNNHERLEGLTLTINGSPLTSSLLKSLKGLSVNLVVSGFFAEAVLTHVVLDFELDMEQMTANIAQLGKNLDYTMFDTTGNLNVHFPMTQGRCESGDLIHVPSKNLLLKVTDVTYSQSAGNIHFEWQCNTRVIQPQEPIHSIIDNKLLR